MTRDWRNIPGYPMRPKFARLRGLLGVRASVTVLSVLFFAVSVPVSSATDLTPPPSEHLFSDAQSPTYPLLLGAFNGLVVENDVDENGEARGLDLVRRAPPPGVSSLGNNQFQTNSIELGQTQWWYIPQAVLEGKGTNDTSESSSSDSVSKRSPTTVYLSLTMCSAPNLNASNSNNVPSLPQLEVYVSQSESLQQPGPGKDSSKQNVTRAEEGYLGTNFTAASNVYIGVSAPNSTEYTGLYNYQIAVSIDAFFHSVNETADILTSLDTSYNAGLLATSGAVEYLTHNQSKLWNDSTPVYTMFAYNSNITTTAGLRRSFCALKQLSQVSKDNNLVTSMTQYNGIQEQFYVTGLNRSSTYIGILAIDGNSTSSGNGIIGGGGKVWSPMNFTTKADDNCALLFDLDFCSDVAYSVPTNYSLDLPALRTVYDSYAETIYQNFNYSLQQIQCAASNESIYSMAVTCDDCAKAYREWLCRVTIPKCADVPPITHLNTNATIAGLDGTIIRNTNQSFPNGTRITNKALLNVSASLRSRNNMIYSEIKPGPYLEILPDLEYCHNLVKACPMSFGFDCPQGPLLKFSYSVKNTATRILPSPPSYIQMGLSPLLLLGGFFWLF